MQENAYNSLGFVIKVLLLRNNSFTVQAAMT